MSTLDASLQVELPLEVVQVTNIPEPITITDTTIAVVVSDIGLRGVPGQDGSGAATFTVDSVADLGGTRAVTGALVYADKDTESDAGKVIGVTVGAALTGDPVVIQSSGKMTGFVGLTPNAPVYLGNSGILTQTLPVTGFIQQLGIAITADTVIIEIGTPIGR